MPCRTASASTMGFIDEPGLPLGLPGQVELLLLVVEAADHGADVAVGRVDGDEGGGGLEPEVERPGGRLDDVDRLLLPLDVDAGDDLEAAVEHRGRPELLGELAGDVVDEVVGHALVVVRRALVHVQLARHLLVGALLRDVALVGHELQHLVALLLGHLGVGGGRVGGRELGHRREHRRLFEVQRGGVLVEVRARRRLDAVGAGAVVHRVEVRGEDAVLGPAVLELPGEHGLAELALVGALVADVGVLDVLLGDGRPALDDRAGLDVEDHGAHDGLVVDAVVLVEALVLDGHRGLLHHVRDLGAGDDDAVLAAVQLGQEHLAGAVVDGGVDGELVALEVVERGQVAGDGVDGAGGYREAGDDREQHGDDEELDDEPHAAARLDGLLLALAPAPRDVLRLDAVSRVLSHGSPLYRDERRAAPRARSRAARCRRHGLETPADGPRFTRARGSRCRRLRPESLPRRQRPPSSAARTGRSRSRSRTARTEGRTWPAC